MRRLEMTAALASQRHSRCAIAMLTRLLVLLAAAPLVDAVKSGDRPRRSR